MNYVLHIGIFIAVLIVYLHVQAHFRSAPSSDVFELDGIIDTRIDDVLDLKQPVIFRSRTCEKLVQDINIHAILRDIGTTTVDVFVSPVSSTSCSSKNTRVAVSLDSFVKLQQVDISLNNKEIEDTDTTDQGHKTNTSYYSDGNDKLINGLSKETKNIISAHHTHIAPPMTCTTRYDMLFGTDHSTTTMRRHVAHRTYFTVTNGTMEAKLIHPDQLNDVVFVSDPEVVPDPMTSVMIDDEDGSIQVTNKYKGVAKDVTVYTGQTLFVPPYWGVILQFTRNTFVVAAKYSTYMTEIATCSHQAQFWYHKLTARPTIVPDTHVPKPIVESVADELEPVIDTEAGTKSVTNDADNDTPEPVETVLPQSTITDV